MAVIIFFYLINKRSPKDILKNFGFKMNLSFIIGLVLSAILLYAFFFSIFLYNTDLALALGISLNIVKVFKGLFLSFISIFINNALWEEILFRGYIQNVFYEFFNTISIFKFKLKGRVNLTKKFSFSTAGILAIVFTSLLFVFPHYPTINPLTYKLRFLNIFLTSIVFGIIYQRTKNIWYSSFAHAWFNNIMNVIRQLITDRALFGSEIIKKTLEEQSNFDNRTIQSIKDLARYVYGVKK